MAGNERQGYFADAQVIVGRVEPACRLHGEIEIPVPVAPWSDVAAGCANDKGKQSCIGEEKTIALDANIGIKAANGRCAMMIPIVGQQDQTERQPVLRQFRIRAQPPRRIRRMRPGLHPDACLYLAVFDLVGPYRNGVVEMKASDPHMPRRRDGAALPSIGEQRPRAGACDQSGIGLGEYEAASQR